MHLPFAHPAPFFCPTPIVIFSSVMSSTVQEPSQPERLEDVAVAGAGADEKGNSGHQIPEQAPNGLVETHSDQSDGVVDPKADAGQDVKPPQELQRSKGKVALIMGSLMVRILNWKSVNASNAEEHFRSLSSLLPSIL